MLALVLAVLALVLAVQLLPVQVAAGLGYRGAPPRGAEAGVVLHVLVRRSCPRRQLLQAWG